MPALSGLPGTDGRDIDVEMFRSVTAGMNLLKRDGATCAAGDEGSINLWLDDEGYYRADFHRHYESIGSHKGATLKSVKIWLKKWLPYIDEEPQAVPAQAEQAEEG